MVEDGYKAPSDAGDYSYDTPFETWAASSGILTNVPNRTGALATSWSVDSKYGKIINDAMMASEREFVRDLLMQVKHNVRGAICEFGVFEGEWLKTISDHCLDIGLERPTFGFDSFEGLPAPKDALDIPGFRQGDYAASFDLVCKRLECDKRNITLIKGWFSDTLYADQARGIQDIAFARIDCDLYEPTVQCLEYLTTRLVDGSILVFDDWSWWFGHGEARAFFEWAPRCGMTFEFLALNSWIHLYLRVHRNA